MSEKRCSGPHTSVWDCPKCSAEIEAKRIDELTHGDGGGEYNPTEEMDAMGFNKEKRVVLPTPDESDVVENGHWIYDRMDRRNYE